MDKVDVTIQIEVERLDALNFFLFNKENTSLKTELQKTVEAMYIKHVPEDTRRFIERKNKPSAGTKPKTRRSTRSTIPAEDASADGSSVDSKEEQ